MWQKDKTDEARQHWTSALWHKIIKEELLTEDVRMIIQDIIYMYAVLTYLALAVDRLPKGQNHAQRDTRSLARAPDSNKQVS